MKVSFVIYLFVNSQLISKLGNYWIINYIKFTKIQEIFKFLNINKIIETNKRDQRLNNFEKLFTFSLYSIKSPYIFLNFRYALSLSNDITSMENSISYPLTSISRN
jgi:hypothetical protein